MKKTTLTLEKGIIRDDKTIKKITLTKPNAGHMRGLKFTNILQFDIDSLAVLLPRISSPALTTDEVYQFDFADLTATTETFAGFLEPSSQPRST